MGRPKKTAADVDQSPDSTTETDNSKSLREQLREEFATVDAQINELSAVRDQLTKSIDQLIEAEDAAIPANQTTLEIRRYLDSQIAARQARVERQMQLQQVAAPHELADLRSPIDAARRRMPRSVPRL